MNFLPEEIDNLLEKLKKKEQKIRPLKFTPLSESVSAKALLKWDDLKDISLVLNVVLGETMLSVKDVLDLKEGSVIRLDKLIGEPAEVVIGQTVFGKGEVLVINELFGIRFSTESEVSFEEALE